MIEIGGKAAGLDKPLEHLTACHRRIEQRLATLVRAGEVFESNPTEARQAIANSLAFLESSGVRHTQDEEASLFPRLLPKLNPEDAAFVEALEAEHKEADAVFTELRELAANISSGNRERYLDAAQRLQAIYSGHIAIEDSRLNPLAAGKLDTAELAAIAEEMRARRGLPCS
jgi:hemerythrin-like domain-containing protein